MAETILLDAPLSARQIAAVAGGACLALSAAARERIVGARRIVEAVIAQGIRAYGVSTGVGAFSDTLIDRPDQAALSRNILFSHACGVGAPLSEAEARAVMAAQINLFVRGHSGVRLELVERLVALLNAGLVPVIPARGSVGYLTYGAEIGLLLIGEGKALRDGAPVPAAEVLEAVGIDPLPLEAKEGLSLVNGTPCSTGLAALAMSRLERLEGWADAAAALSLAVLGRQEMPFGAEAMALRASPEIAQVAARLQSALAGVKRPAGALRTQDALSLRGVPHVHAALRSARRQTGEVLAEELASVTDNPAVAGTPEAPVVHSTAHAMASTLAASLDHLAIASTQVGMASERRTDRLLNPVVSGLPAFLAPQGGLQSGLMIAQYTAAGLVGETRRLAAPASLDGGITSALQEDVLAQPTAAAEKLGRVIDNLQLLLAIELHAAAQAVDLMPGLELSPLLAELHAAIRAVAPVYRDDRPLNSQFGAVAAMLEHASPLDAGATPNFA